MTNCVEKKFAEIKEGDAASFEIMIDESLVDRFAELSGDMNPLHTDAVYAGSTQLKKRVAHGQISGALFSRLIGMYLPGKYSLYLKQTSEFVNPIFPGTEVRVSGLVTKKIESVGAVEIKTVLSDKFNGIELVRGSALVKLLA